ncbi:MAG: N-6 DNA methylase [Candidatus Portnoybacteria bacterium]|nr:N-6 DNA methylase [Candidatus Portnoybacteria bacterium]
MVEKQRQLGQFFTKNSDYILQGMKKYIYNKDATDPFAGNQDLIKWAKGNKAKVIKGYDIDKNYIDDKTTFLNDSINKPLKYKFVLTNPPYLHKNKAKDETKNKYFIGKNSEFEDLYQVSINSILDSEEGILIIPLNFLSAENSNKIRKIFFNKFKIISLNIFEEQVFEDTTYNVISFYYKKRRGESKKDVINAKIFPREQKIQIILEEKHGWQMGGEFRSKIDPMKNLLGIYRATEDLLFGGSEKVELAYNHIKDKRTFYIDKYVKELFEKNIILLRAIDNKNGKKIQLEDIRKYGPIALIGKNTSRNMAYLLFKEKISLREQQELIDLFNNYLNKERQKHFSLFLTNFRDNGRKRISFDFVYKLINYLYFNKLNNNQKVLFH